MKLSVMLGLDERGFDLEHGFVTSWLFPPVVFAIIRFALATYAFGTIICSYSWFAGHTVTFVLKDIKLPIVALPNGRESIGRSFSYFTYLSYWSLSFYFLVAGVHTFIYSRKRTSPLHSSFPAPLQILHSVFYTTVTCFPILITVIFWGSMFHTFEKSTVFYRWHNLSIHGLNGLFGLFEVIFANTAPPPVLHLVILCTIMSVYLGLAYLTRATSGFWVYEWMDPVYGAAQIVGHVFGYAALIVGVFGFVWSIIWSRRWAIGRNKREKEKIGDEESVSSSSSGDESEKSPSKVASTDCQPT